MTEQVVEIIGLNSTVIQSSNNDLVGTSGKIIDETKHMIIMNTESGKKLIPKKICKMQIIKNNKKIIIDGAQIIKRPYEKLEVFL